MKYKWSSPIQTLPKHSGKPLFLVLREPLFQLHSRFYSFYSSFFPFCLSGCFSAKWLGKHSFIKYKSDTLLGNLNPRRICPVMLHKKWKMERLYYCCQKKWENMNENDCWGVSSMRFHLNSIPHWNLYNLMGLHITKWNKSTFLEEMKMLRTAVGGACIMQGMASTNHRQNLVPLQSTDSIWGFGAMCSGNSHWKFHSIEDACP